MMRGVFIGQNGSMGFERGKAYVLKSFASGNVIILQDVATKRSCSYTSIEAILTNWDLSLNLFSTLRERQNTVLGECGRELENLTETMNNQCEIIGNLL